MRAHLLRPAAAILLALLIACASDPRSANTTAVRDSAGVRIVENLAPSIEPTWRLSDLPSLSIGTLDGLAPYSFNQVSSVMRLGDGRLLVAQEAELRYFDAEGRHLHTAGGAGQGPGEFGRIRSVRPCGAGLIATDLLVLRVSLLDMEGGFIRAVDAPEPVAGALPDVVRCLDGEPVYSVWTRGSGERATVSRDPLSLVRFVGGGAHDTLAVVPGLERFDGLTRPFGRTTVYALEDTVLHLADTGECEIRSYDLDGELRRIVRCAAEGGRVTDADVAAIREQYTAGVPPRMLETEILPRLNAVPFPETKPTVADLRADAVGRLWLRPFDQPSDDPATRDGPTSWWIFDTDGSYLGTIAMPAGLTIHHIGANEILGVWRDSMEIEYVHVYELVGPRG